MRRRRVLDRAGFVASSLAAALIQFVVFFGSVPAVPAYWRPEPAPGVLTDIGAVVVLVTCAVLPLFFLRRRLPWYVFGAGLLVTVVLRLDAFLLLVTMTSLITFRPRREAWVAGVVGTLVALAAGLRDGMREWMQTSWSELIVLDPTVYGEEDMALQMGVSLAIAVVSAAIAIALGMIGRTRHALGAAHRATEDAQLSTVRAEAERARAVALKAQAEQAAAEERLRNADLEFTVTRQEERERLAQEVHDALAHRLSLISLHSGALEDAAHSSDPAVAEAADVLRTNAHRSLEDLRDLIGALRQPAGPGRPMPADEPAAPPRQGLAAIPELIDNARRSGITVHATVLIQDADRASDMLGRVAYRLVQESLTNAFKHAPGQPVTLDIRCSEASGVHLRVSNPVGGPDAQLPGAGSGVIGMRERAAMVGGEVTADVRERPATVQVQAPGDQAQPGGDTTVREFVVEAHLPWGDAA